MPQLKGQSIDLSSRKSGAKPKEKKGGTGEDTEKKPRPTTSKKAASSPAPAQRMRRLIDEDDDDDEELEGTDANEDDDDNDEEEDDVIRSAVKRKKEGKTPNLKFIGGAAVVVVLVVFGFLIFGGKGPTADPPPSNPTTQQPEDNTSTGDVSTPSTESPTPPEVPDDINVGTQNFLDNTTMDSNSPLTDPDNYIKDLYGLSTQVNYTVSKISTATDFVSYTKYRGTWGGGLELYYLDAEYKGNHYVIQVPFQYYKELDDVGIVPVKMEVLRVLNEVDGNYLTIISYMCLDENTLKAVLKTQSK